MMQDERPTTDAEATDAPSPYLDETAARERVEGWLVAAGLPGVAALPIDNATAVRVCHALGYSLDLGFVLAWCDDARFVGVTPRLVAGRRSWEARHLFALVGRLEHDRRWQALHPVHACKVSLVARQAALAEQDGFSAADAIGDLKLFSPRDLLLVLARCDDPTMRLAMADVVLVKLDALGFDADAR